MTIPTRPAPAPPKLSASQSAATTANYSLQQLHLLEQEQQQTQQQQQLLHHHHQQQQSQFAAPTKLKIKLPPSQKNSNNRTITCNNGFNGNKFPQTDYISASNLNDSPFSELIGCQSAKTNSVKSVGVKKVPPPRPPPPKLSSKKTAAPPPPPSLPAPTPTPLAVPASFQKSSNLLSNIFQRKKSTRAPTPTAAARVYNSAIYGSNASSSNLSITNSSAPIKKSNRSISGQSIQQTNSITAETQLISFDSPPSSPTFTQKSNSDCLSVDSFSSDSNFSSPNNESISQPESGFEDDFSAVAAVRSRPATTSPLDPWETCITADANSFNSMPARYASVGTVPVRNLNAIHMQSINDNPLCNGVPTFKVAPAVTATVPTIIKPKISHKPKAKAPKPPILQLQTHPNTPKEKCRDEFAIPPSPPMPRYAPPPPPPSTSQSPSPSPPLASTSPSSSISEFNQNSVTIFDVISSGKVETSQMNSAAAAANYSNSNFYTITQPYGIALYDFDSMEDGDLCFRENEVIYLLEQINNDWYRGRTRSGCEGILPANYIDIRIPLKKQAVNKNNSTNTNLNTTTYGNGCTVKGAMQAICLYNFPKEVDGDLELKENDVVTIHYKINDDWLFGEANGRKGQFPANFLDSLPAYIPTMH